MTMILTCLAKDFIVQASDRRFSYPDKSKPPEDHNNKALIYGNHFVFAFTGLARLSGKSAIDWAAQQMSEKEGLEAAVLHLGNRASDLMNNFYSSYPADKKKLAFVGAGFADIEEGGRLKRKPLRIVISNFRGEKGTWLAQSRKEFIVYYDWLPERHICELFVAGQKLSDDRKNKLNKLIAFCLRHKKGPETIGRLLTREIQAVADGGNETVGKNIMCTFVPRAFGSGIKIHPGAMLLENPINSTEPQRLEPVKFVSVHDRFAFPPPFDSPRFVYIAGDNQALPYHSPIYVFPRNVVQMSMDEISITVPPVVQIPSSQVDTP